MLLPQPPPLVAYFQKNVSGEKLSQKRQKRMATFLIEIVENYPKQMNKFSFKFPFSFHRGHRLHKDFLTEHSERWKTVKMRKAKSEHVDENLSLDAWKQPHYQHYQRQ